MNAWPSCSSGCSTRETIRSYVSVAPLLPSPVVSAAENRARWRQFWKDSAERLASTMSIEVAKLGFSPTAFAPFLEELRADGPAEGAAVALDLTSGPLAAVLRDHVAVAEGQTLVLTRLEVTRHEELAAIRRAPQGDPGRPWWSTAASSRSTPASSWSRASRSSPSCRSVS